MDKIKRFYGWYTYTAFPLGLLSLGVLLALVMRTGVSTVTCMVAEVNCKYAYQANDAIADSMLELIDGNKGQDIVIKPKSKR